MMATKKVVFVIVEGPSDADALGVLLEKIYDKKSVYVYITHGDVTTEKDTNTTNILKKITDTVKGYAKSNHFTYVHFQEVVHIVDTDGAYIPEGAVKEDPEAKEPYYTLSNIFTDHVQGIKARNRQKQECLNKLMITDKIWNIPYQVYYMSCNLDHVLHNKQNSSDEEKEADSLAFVKKYREDIDGFTRFILESDFAVPGTYPESWKYIKEDLRSLERHTNFGICLLKAKANVD